MAVASPQVSERSSRDSLVTGHPIANLVVRRLAVGVLTLLVVSIVDFLATEVLPGNAALAVLGRTATPARLRALERQLHLNRGLADQYWIWLSGLLTGKLGTSLANGQPVWALVKPRWHPLIEPAGPHGGVPPGQALGQAQRHREHVLRHRPGVGAGIAGHQAGWQAEPRN
jgi:hypothetical protein